MEAEKKQYESKTSREGEARLQERARQLVIEERLIYGFLCRMDLLKTCDKVRRKKVRKNHGSTRW